MADRELTLLELHFHSNGDVQVGPRSVDAGGLRGSNSSNPGEETGGNRSTPLPVIGGAVLVVVLAILYVWRESRAE